MTFRFAEEALAEYVSAAQFYESQVPGLGIAFVEMIEEGVRKTVNSPRAWRPVEDDVRRYLIRRFPYGIYYTIENEVVVIWAVKHLRRDPDYWQERRR